MGQLCVSREQAAWEQKHQEAIENHQEVRRLLADPVLYLSFCQRYFGNCRPNERNVVDLHEVDRLVNELLQLLEIHDYIVKGRIADNMLLLRERSTFGVTFEEFSQFMRAFLEVIEPTLRTKIDNYASALGPDQIGASADGSRIGEARQGNAAQNVVSPPPVPKLPLQRKTSADGGFIPDGFGAAAVPPLPEERFPRDGARPAAYRAEGGSAGLPPPFSSTGGASAGWGGPAAGTGGSYGTAAVPRLALGQMHPGETQAQASQWEAGGDAAEDPVEAIKAQLLTCGVPLQVVNQQPSGITLELKHVSVTKDRQLICLSDPEATERESFEVGGLDCIELGHRSQAYIQITEQMHSPPAVERVLAFKFYQGTLCMLLISEEERRVFSMAMKQLLEKMVFA